MIITFLALLEIVRMRLARATQAVPGGQIVVAALASVDDEEEAESDAGAGEDAGGEDTWRN